MNESLEGPKNAYSHARIKLTIIAVIISMPGLCRKERAGCPGRDW